jgi:hypothetical protein
MSVNIFAYVAELVGAASILVAYFSAYDDEYNWLVG